jgi:CheY-like chemotaxis protein
MSQSVTILLVEDISTVQFFVRNALTALPKPYQLVTAPSMTEARSIITDRPVDLLIVDIGLPDGDGIDFLCEAAMLQPQATAIIITASPSDANRARAEQLGVVQLLSKPLQREKLVAAAVKLLGWDEQRKDEAPNFRATLSGLTTMDIIQLKCMSGATGIIEFTNAHGSGRVHFEKGDVIHATVRDAEGNTKIGYEAFEEVVGWQSGRVAEVHDQAPCPRTIRTGWQSLLLEVAQSRDEIQGRAA